jgi:hypothetical protein
MIHGWLNWIARTHDELRGRGVGYREQLPNNTIGTFTDDIEKLVVTTCGKVGYAGIYRVLHVVSREGERDAVGKSRIV